MRSKLIALALLAAAPLSAQQINVDTTGSGALTSQAIETAVAGASHVRVRIGTRRLARSEMARAASKFSGTSKNRSSAGRGPAAHQGGAARGAQGHGGGGRASR